MDFFGAGIDSSNCMVVDSSLVVVDSSSWVMVSMVGHIDSLLESCCCYPDISLDWNCSDIVLDLNYRLGALVVDLVFVGFPRSLPLLRMVGDNIWWDGRRNTTYKR